MTHSKQHAANCNKINSFFYQVYFVGE